MLDLAGILFSSTIMFVIIVRVLRLDRIEPWFPQISRPPPPAPSNRPWRRRI